MPSATSTSPPRRPIPDSMISSNPPDLSAKLPRLTPRSKVVKKQARFEDETTSVPPPETQPLPEPPLHPTFMHPARCILSTQDHEAFLASSTCDLIMSFILNITDSVVGRSISSVAAEEQHPTITALLSLLDHLSSIVLQHPPLDNGSRFGNPVFRDYMATLTTVIPKDLEASFPNLPAAAIDELSTYLLSSLGSPTRLDYGSGHELHFLIATLSLNRLSLLPPSAFPSIALLLLPSYLRLMRTLQATYYLEPAGSHGVWGLDDYHFLPFLFGAAQLTAHPFLRPRAIHSPALVDEYADDFLYLDMVRALASTKTVRGLRWHSPMLDDISGVRGGWGKVAAGLKKMLASELLGKRVVMQHFLFGGLIPAAEGMTGPDGARSALDGHGGHAHGHDDGERGKGWGDCCGIPVPSSVAAAQEMGKSRDAGLRPLPFD